MILVKFSSKLWASDILRFYLCQHVHNTSTSMSVRSQYEYVSFSTNTILLCLCQYVHFTSTSLSARTEYEYVSISTNTIRVHLCQNVHNTSTSMSARTRYEYIYTSLSVRSQCEYFSVSMYTRRSSMNGPALFRRLILNIPLRLSVWMSFPTNALRIRSEFCITETVFYNII